MTGSDRIVLCGLNARYVHTNLALRSLLAYVRRQWPDAPALTLLEWTVNDQELAILQRLFSQHAAIYAFSCYIWNITLVRRISRDLKKLLPTALVVWGGPEAGLAAAGWLASEPAVDLIIRGEGEEAWLTLLRTLYLAEGRPELAVVPNLSWREPAGGIVENPAAPLLDAAAWPFPYGQADLAGLADRIVYYESSRGCPFQCTYCLSALDRTVRHRPLDQVFEELDFLIAAGLQQVKLVDRTFNCFPERAFRIWQHIIDRAGLAGRTNFHFEVAGDLLDDATVDLLNQAPPGLIQLEIGVQTIHPDVLAAINRPARLDRLAAQVEKLRHDGRVHLHLDLIAGLPGENLERFSESLDWVYRLHPHQLQLGFLKVLPGSPLAGQAAGRGFLWQEAPPYEILQSDSLDFGDLTLLKHVAQILDGYLNSGFCAQALAWLAGRRERPWLTLAGLAVMADRLGLLERPPGPAERCRLLLDYALASDPELAAAAWPGHAWRDLLRLDYQLSGQKDQPAWLGFPDAVPEKAQAFFRRRHPQSGRLRINRLSFDLGHWLACGELRPDSWLACLELSGARPAMLDNCRENDLY